MRNSSLFWTFTSFLLLVAVRGDDVNEDDENLLTTIRCKVGDKYEYVMATQSSLLDQADANLLIKTKLELKCLEKKLWLNETSGQLKNGQWFEGRIVSVTPIHLNASNSKMESLTIKSGRLQMAALFASLDQIPDNSGNSTDPSAADDKTKQPNLKVGAVNTFFTDFGKSFSELVSQLFQKLVKFFENLFKRRNSASVRTANSGFSWKCKNGQTVQASARTNQYRRQKRQSFTSINFGTHFPDEINSLFRHPFSFIQLEDGSVVNVQLSPADTNPSVGHFKRFLAQSFATQLDERKKTAVEKSSLGDHLSHYEMEYDEPDRGKVTPEEYMRDARATVVRSRRAASNGRTSGGERSHLVSVVRVIKRADMLQPANGGQERNQLRHKTLALADVEFNAQQVQLIEDNMLVASGGYFHSVLPLVMESKNEDGSKQRRARSVKSDSSTEGFDEVLEKFMTMNLEYSMVRITKNRWRRSVDAEKQPAHAHLSNLARKRYISAMEKAAHSGADFTSTSLKELSRRKRESSPESSLNKDIVCRSVQSSKSSPKSNSIEDQLDPTQMKECTEYKEFGSRWLKAFYNRSIITGTRRGKSLDAFETKYRLGAQLMGETLFMGSIDLSKNEDASKLRINLFGSEYIDLNLCDIREKVFSQANAIPLFAENIWFMTNVGINLRYDLQFKVEVPGAVCGEPGPGASVSSYSGSGAPEKESSANNSAILGRMIEDEVNLMQNTKIEIGGVFDASFLIFNGEMRLNGNFDMDSNIDFGRSCLSARSLVRPMNVSLDFNYKYFHPLCNEWQEDSWIPKQLSWRLNKAHRSSWFDNLCVA